MRGRVHTSTPELGSTCVGHLITGQCCRSGLMIAGTAPAISSWCWGSSCCSWRVCEGWALAPFYGRGQDGRA